MLPSRVTKCTSVYGTPRGVGAAVVGGLPYWRETVEIREQPVPEIFSAWKPSPEELACLNAGAYIVLGILGEPIPPVSLNVEYLDPAE